MDLVIVESPTKAKTLSKFLGSDYKIVASMGHVRDLPQDRLGIDVNHDFVPRYQILAGHKKVIEGLKQEAAVAKKIILATDPDREGEAIAWHISEILKVGAIQRITFHEITGQAINEALKNPGTLNLRLVDAQQARRVLDRLVGYKLSPLLWSKVRRGLSAGRVQSVALRIVCEREKERERFESEEYWSIVLKAEERGSKADFELISKDGIKYETSGSFDLYDGKYTVTKTTIANKEQAEMIINDIKKYIVYISDIERKATKRYPLPPFTTSTLQQEAGRKLGFSAKKTMQLAQRLYENGFITYHRTDSVNLATEAVSRVRGFIKKEFGENYLPESPRFYQTKQKLAQEAHEAIRPTEVKFEILNSKFEIGRDAERVYDLIWKRFVACQMREAEIERTAVWGKTAEDLSHLSDLSNLGYLFKAAGTLVTFPGFLKVYPDALEDNPLPVFEKGQKLSAEEILPIQHFTEPPPRYSEASLIAILEEKGIGRPSTYAPTVSLIQDRHYVEKEETSDGKKTKRLKPTVLGIAVNDFLVANFPHIDDMPFTAVMEDELDQIAKGEKQWVPVIRNFFTPFSESLQQIYKTAERVKIEAETTNEKCPDCGSPLVVRIGRFGKFLACSRFPECKFTKNLTVGTGLKCPKDAGDVVLKRTKRGKTFYGCSNWPKCDWASWTKPRSLSGRGEPYEELSG